MTVQSALARLAVLQGQVPGVNKAYASPPNSLNSADCPFMFTLVGADDFDQDAHGEGLGLSLRSYNMYLGVGQLGSGGPGELPARVEPFFDSVKLFFLARPTLGGLVGVQRTHWRGDRGVISFEYAGQTWVGTVFQLDVEEVTPYAYATGE